MRAVAGTPAARRLGDADVCVERVLAAMQAAMRHAQQQEAAAAEDRERRRLRARQGSLGLSVASVESPAGASGEGLAGGAGEGGVSAASCALGSLEALLVLQAAARGDGMGRAVARGGSGAGGSVNVAANNVAPATAVGSSLQQQGGASPAALSDTVPAPPAAAVAVGFDPAAELGLSAEEASRAAAAYARCGRLVQRWDAAVRPGHCRAWRNWEGWPLLHGAVTPAIAGALRALIFEIEKYAMPPCLYPCAL